MICKNCQSELTPESKYCTSCGAKVVDERITTTHLLTDFTNAFGWDNRYFTTLRHLISRPGILFKEYLGGTRNKFANPFTYFAIGAAISLLVFNQFADDYIRSAKALGEHQTEILSTALPDTTTVTDLTESTSFKDQQNALNEKVQMLIFKNYNLFAFLLLPLYALIAFLVFGKPYNYGEHLVINAYIQGTTFLVATVMFLVSLATHPAVHGSSILIVILYYCYTYGTLYQLTTGKLILKFLKFIGVLLIIPLVLVLIGLVVGLIKAML
jgi:hypothetical protein